MYIPQFIKEIVWTFYPPRYKQLSAQPLSKSIFFMSKMLLVAFLITGILYLPSVLLLRNTVEQGLANFDTLKFSWNVTQTAPLVVPHHNPWFVVDVNSNLSLSKEFIVIDKSTIQYRVFTVHKIPRDHLTDVIAHRSTVGMFLSGILLLLAPGIAFFLYLRIWFKYFFLVLVFGTLFFIISDLSRYRLTWKQMMNIAAHAITPVILLEVISSFVSAIYLLPVLHFLGINIYAISLVVLIVIMILGIIGCKLPERKK